LVSDAAERGEGGVIFVVAAVAYLAGLLTPFALAWWLAHHWLHH